MRYRNIIFIIIILILGLQRTRSLSSEKKQGWWDWFSSKLSASKTTEVMKQRALIKAIELAAQHSGIESHLIINSMDLLLALKEDISEIILSYLNNSIDQNDAIKKIKEDLLLLINNQLLYPTRSSKINVLLKKDEFLQYVNDQDNLVQDACNQLIKEISNLDYSATKKSADEAIDTRVATLKAAIIHGQSLTEQIHELETKIDQKQHFDIPEMQAYLSFYFRLKNKEKVEGKLTKEEKEIQHPWNIKVSEIEKHTISEPEID
ncbi:MAG TPA: hypothetical protein VHX42_02705 [Candidatus Babeliales bacterium]|jgi:hypothetical protein|nr:hypothetical protein [Candidatus Babeliales bacterium]